MNTVSFRFFFFFVMRLSISWSYKPPSTFQEGMFQFQETATQEVGKVNMADQPG